MDRCGGPATVELLAFASAHLRMSGSQSAGAPERMPPKAGRMIMFPA